VLYLRGGAERGIELERYLAGFREHGLCQLSGDTIAGSGHFTPDEQPEQLALRIEQFLRAHARSPGVGGEGAGRSQPDVYAP
jgi:hypothetical protein